MTDQYERSAEFVDAMLAPHWTALGPALSEALRGAPGKVVDVGAGGGHGTTEVTEHGLQAASTGPADRGLWLITRAV
ncbi:hypothetical protein [Nonomuraea sp. 10N515B]|uniref:hypothetical protein n=1 Tax=Nonomuraea sp. 10N515B TaxID=3457422 RepID=UPI003FCE5FD6